MGLAGATDRPATDGGLRRRLGRTTVTPDEIERAAVQLRHQLATTLAKDGYLRSPQWRAAVEAVPRHEFVPQFFNMFEDTSPTQWEPIDAERSGAEHWLRLPSP